MTAYVKRDGKVVALLRDYTSGKEPVSDENAGFVWLLQHQGQSVNYATTHGGYSYGVVEGVSLEEAKQLTKMARQLMYGDQNHNTGTWHDDPLTRANCAACVLGGYIDPDDDRQPEDGPNYAGWARIYIEAGRAIPRSWEEVFTAQRDSDNLEYAYQLERSIATFGIHWKD